MLTRLKYFILGILVGIGSFLLKKFTNKPNNPDSVGNKLENLNDKVNQVVDSNRDFIADRQHYPKVDKLP